MRAAFQSDAHGQFALEMPPECGFAALHPPFFHDLAVAIQQAI
jgi:hypothetical protein